MAKRTLPSGGFNGNPQGNLVWLSATKVVVARFAIAGVSPAEIGVVLAISNDAGVTWTTLESTAMIYSGSIAPTPDEDAPHITQVAKDSSNNIYVNRAGTLIKFTKGSGDTWTGAAYSISSWGGYAYGSLMFVTGSNAITIFTAVDDTYENTIHKYVTTNLTSWTKTTVASSSGSGDRKFWYRAAAMVDGVPEVVYGTRAGAASAISHGGFGTLSQTNFDYIKVIQMATTADGKTHMVYFTTNDSKMWHKTRTGSTWGAAVEIGTYSNTVGTNGDYSSSSKVGYGDYYQENNAYASLSTDGSGLFLFWVEKNGDVYTVKSRVWNGTAWSSATNHGNFDSDSDLYVYNMMGPFNQPNLGIGTLLQREEGVGISFYDATNSYPPSQPSGLTPSGGAATSDLTPDLSYTFNHPNPAETQSARQIIVYRQSDSTVMWDSGKITSAATTVTYAGTTLVHGVTYQWKVRTYDSVDAVSPYSSLAVFKESAAPTATMVYPVDNEIINTDTPLIEWNYADSESTPQLKYLVEILNNAGDTVLHSSGLTVSAEDYYQVPLGVLSNGGEYQVRVTVTDSDNISSTPVLADFDVEFVAPPAPDFSAANDGEGNIKLVIDLNPPEDAAWPVDDIKLYKKLASDVEFNILESSIPVLAQVVDNMNVITGWAASSQGTTPIISDPKEGVKSLGLGASGAGNAIYTKTVSVPNISNYDEVQAWLYSSDITKFDKIRIKLGTDASNYYYFDVENTDMDDGVWKSAHSPIANMIQVGSPSTTEYVWARIEVMTTTGAITAGTIRIDMLRLLQTHYEYTDYDVANGYSYLYGATTYNRDENLESVRVESALVDVDFNEPGINTYMIPVGYEGAAIKGWMDGSQPPSWTDKTETKYYQTKGSTKPTVVVNGIQSYKEGNVELRFFEPQFGGDGLPGVEALEFIRNVKPILLKTWWGKNYYISIDGELGTVRKPGIGWYSTFNFTEINP